MLEQEGLALEVCKHLHLERVNANNKKWEEMIEHFKKIDNEYKNENKQKVKIAIVGKYIKLEDSYLSVVESIKHASYANEVESQIKFIDSETVTKENAKDVLKEFDGIIVPGGFGNRGIEGKNSNNKICKRKQNSIFRNMFRYADGCCRICKRCA